jgi:hypothetical protein
MNRMRIAFITALLLGTTTVLAYAQEPQNEPKQEEPRTPRQEEPRPANPEKQEAPKMPKDQSKHEEKGQEQAQQGHARPAGKSAHIPDPKFKANFGRQHKFAVKQVINTTTVVAGQTQFVYGGYTFIILDPWPSEWLFTDDCYIDYVDDEYFLFDVFHPGIRIALFVQA